MKAAKKCSIVARPAVEEAPSHTRDASSQIFECATVSVLGRIIGSIVYAFRVLGCV